MTQEELVQFLKENLRLEMRESKCWDATEIGVAIYLGDEIITSDFVQFN